MKQRGLKMFMNRNLSVIAYANGFTLWHYKNTVDDLNTILKTGYFDTVKCLCATGDIFIINAKDGTAIKTLASMDEHVLLDTLK